MVTLNIIRCAWAEHSPDLMQYHDEEWGLPLHDDQKLFEFLSLDSFQAGLSWELILKRRPAFRDAFSNFDPNIVASYGDAEIDSLINNPLIIRNHQKILATISNARAFLITQQEFGSFDKYIWSFVGGNPIINRWTTMNEIPVSTEQASQMSKDLKSRGFKFAGPTICYAFMQATGMVNDHLITCFNHPLYQQST